MGAMAVLVLQDKADLESIMARVEWTTLVFFATLFVVIEALNRLGLLEFIGKALFLTTSIRHLCCY